MKKNTRITPKQIAQLVETINLGAIPDYKELLHANALMALLGNGCAIIDEHPFIVDYMENVNASDLMKDYPSLKGIMPVIPHEMCVLTTGSFLRVRVTDKEKLVFERLDLPVTSFDSFIRFNQYEFLAGEITKNSHSDDAAWYSDILSEEMVKSVADFYANIFEQLNGKILFLRGDESRQPYLLKGLFKSRTEPGFILGITVVNTIEGTEQQRTLSEIFEQFQCQEFVTTYLKPLFSQVYSVNEANRIYFENKGMTA